MSLFDVAVLCLVAAGFFWGLLKGIVRIVVLLASVVTGFLLASWYAGDLATDLSAVGRPAWALRLLAFAVIFAGVVLAGEVIAWVLRRLVKAALLGWADRLAGAALGVAAAFVTSAFFVLPIVAHTGGAKALAGSRLAPYVSVVSDLASRAVPEALAREYRRRVAGLRRHWSGAPDEEPQEPDRARAHGPV